ncbi:MAG: hydantoinase/oxoprolinase N-terminal domain-containing protein, partial [Actinomycetota bacterium]|nr:hydantoinase/oxoprolinase N-terminal domain-containing protein [Actinomycetota bacterium]
MEPGTTTARVGIGMDTGGTFTDAVAVDLDSGEILAKAKRPTTRDDLAIGIRDALSAIEAGLYRGVELVSLSTTLATNAVVEGRGARVGLIIAVPDPATFDLPAGLPAAEVAVVAGAHTPAGSLRTPLDTRAAAAAVARISASVDAFAVSAYFSIANAEHEAAIKALIAETCGAPVVCGHELSQQV